MSEEAQNPEVGKLVKLPMGGGVERQSITDLEQNFALAVRQRELLSEYIGKQLKPGKHFYEVKGGNRKPSLTKEGAEIILLPHNYTPDYDIVSGPAEPPEDGGAYQITVKCTLRRKGDSGFVGSGIGSAGSKKGTWQNQRWIYAARQMDRYLCHNATLKMAQKSALIAATINATAASEFFTQDLEDTGITQSGQAQSGQAQSGQAQRAKPPTKAPAPKGPTEKHRNRMLTLLLDKFPQPALLRWAKAKGYIGPEEGLADWPVSKTPTSKEQMEALLADCEGFGKPPKKGKAKAGDSPQAQLSTLCKAAGFTWEQLLAWALETGNLLEEVSGFEELAEERAVYFIKNFKGIAKMLSQPGPPEELEGDDGDFGPQPAEEA